MIDEDRFPGRQSRLLCAYLVVKQDRPVPRDEFAKALWREVPPATVTGWAADRLYSARDRPDRLGNGDKSEGRWRMNASEAWLSAEQCVD